MTSLGWMLSRLSRKLFSFISDDHETSFLPPEVPMTLDMVNKDEILQNITSSLIEEIVMNVVRDAEDREEIVTQAVANLIDIYLDSKNDQREYSREDEILVKEVVEEMIDGITEMVCEEPSEPIIIETVNETTNETANETTNETSELSESIALCELVLLAMNRLVIVS